VLSHQAPRRLLLFDTGLGDRIAEMPNGFKSQVGRVDRQANAHGAGLPNSDEPADITDLVLSHSHPITWGISDFLGVSALGAEGRIDWSSPTASRASTPPRRSSRPKRYDVFPRRERHADFDARHSPGSSKHAGAPAHDWRDPAERVTPYIHKANWDGTKVPSRNFNVPQSLPRFDRMAAAEREQTRIMDRP